MIICLIEFETIPGKENEQEKWLADLMPIVATVPGFKGKESFTHISGDGRISTISYWENEASLKAWTREPRHKRAMKVGKEEIFSRYEIRICSELRHYQYSIDDQ